MKATVRFVARPIVALLCVFASLNGLAVTSSSTFAAEGISQATHIANGKYLGYKPSAAQINKLASTLQIYLTQAAADGSLKVKEAAFLKVAPNYVNVTPTAMITTAYQRQLAYGWMGNSAEVASTLTSFTSAQRKALIQQVQSIGLKATLQQAVAALNKVAAAIQTNGGLCGLEGEFKAVTLIGAVASLGGVDPLGDLLLVVGAAGDFALWAWC